MLATRRTAVDRAGFWCWLTLVLSVLTLSAGGCRGLSTRTPEPSPTPQGTPAAVIIATLTALAVEAEPTRVPPPTSTIDPTSSHETVSSSTPTSTPTADAIGGGDDESAMKTATAVQQAVTATATEQVEDETPTSAPTTEPTPTEQSASPTVPPVSSATPEPETSDEPLPVVTDFRVVYHDGFTQGLVGVYEPGSFPWLDLLVQLGGTWYGPERQPDDGIEASPLPEGYHWVASGGFGALPNGEAWWSESGTSGTATLIGPNGEVVVQIPLEVTFRSSGDGGSDPGPPPTPT
jgi:hypothetical protein